MNGLRRLTLRYLRQHRWHTMLSIIGIALGVAVVLAIDLANASARSAFQMANKAISGSSTHRITGGPGGIDEHIYAQLRVKHGLRTLAPVVSAYVLVEGQRMQLFGIDPFAERGFRNYAQAAATWRPQQLLGFGAAILARETAQRLSLPQDSSISVTAGSNQHRLRVVHMATVNDRLQAEGLRNVIVVDISTAQQVLGMAGKLSHIDVRTDDVSALRAILPPGLSVLTSDSRDHSMVQMTSAFHLNLTALSLLAMVIGGFLIYNTMTLSVLQRRELFATLRTLGTSKTQIYTLVMLEASVLAAAGVMLGTGIGLVLSKTLIHLVSRTINDLYFVVEIRDVSLQASSFVNAVVLGLVGTLLAAAHPAYEALRVSPGVASRRSSLERRTRKLNLPQLGIGLVLWCFAGGILWLSETSVIAGFAALFLIILGFALITPWILIQASHWMRPLLAGSLGILGKMAARGVEASLSRTQIAVTALAIAVSAVVGVSVMITSFRTTVADWLEHTLRADIYISEQQRSAGGIDRQLVQRLSALTAVRTISTGRWTTLETSTGSTQLLAMDLDRSVFAKFKLLQGNADSAWTAFSRADRVIISESYAYRHDLKIGDEVGFTTNRGIRGFAVAGVFRDYGSDRGVVVMHRQVYDQHWDDPVITSARVHLRPGTDADEFLDQINAGVLRDAALHARSNRTIRERSLEIFDRTFVITDILRLIAIVIAVVGILSALMAIQMERAREFAMLHATGMTSRELRTMITAESGLMGFVAGAIACPLGVVMSTVLIFVINRRSFGWTLEFTLELEPLITAFLLSTVGGLLAGWYPGRRVQRSMDIGALRAE